MRYYPPVNAELDSVSGSPRCVVQQMRLSDLGPTANEQQQQQQLPAYICSKTNIDFSAYQRLPVLPVTTYTECVAGEQGFVNFFQDPKGGYLSGTCS